MRNEPQEKQPHAISGSSQHHPLGLRAGLGIHVLADAIQNLKANDVSAGQEWIIHDLETGKSYTYDDVASMTDGQLDAQSNRDCERFELANGPYVDDTALAA